ncbi:DUF4229 domain-containing protein [Ruania alkalisoli]|uniref:DUF4229 domain-containing protein n=1 Tax=Ruania alkalisoli TaxID=2779775 RepID=A0A7M1STE6_9MICO|nr:DUF4229 domain-containing protein [Ruania alkalisoli]QOR70042.1 DUF4229 domain-containing protein [Ruania alkalisoli]
MPVIVYSALRLLLIGLAGAGLYLAGMRGGLLVAAAVLIGAALSYVLLDRFRQASALWLQQRSAGREGRFSRSLREDADAEDDVLDQHGSGSPGADHAVEEQSPEPGPASQVDSDRQHHGQTDTER